MADLPLKRSLVVFVFKVIKYKRIKGEKMSKFVWEYGEVLQFDLDNTFPRWFI